MRVPTNTHTHTRTDTRTNRHTYTDTHTHTPTQIHTHKHNTHKHTTHTHVRVHTDIVSHGLCYHKREKMCWAKLSQISQFSRVLQNVSHEYKRLPLIILNNKNFWLR